MNPAWQDFMHDVEVLFLALDKLGDGKLEDQRRQRDAAARTEPARSPADPRYLNVDPREAKAPTAPERFAALHELVISREEYEPVLVTDSLMGISPLVADPCNLRRSFFKNVSFADFPIVVYTYKAGGPYGHTVYVWRCTDPVDETRQAAAYAMAVRGAPQFAPCGQAREFFERFSVSGAHPTMLRQMFRELSPADLGARNEAQQEIDDRCLRWLAQSEGGEDDVQLFYDRRALNGPDQDAAFGPFWGTLGEFLQLDVGESAQERRHGDTTYLPRSFRTRALPRMPSTSPDAHTALQS